MSPHTNHLPYTSSQRNPSGTISSYEDGEANGSPNPLNRTNALELPNSAESQRIPRSKSLNERTSSLQSSDENEITILTEEASLAGNENLTRQRLVFCRACSTEHVDLCCEELDEVANLPGSDESLKEMEGNYLEILFILLQYR